ncbi:Hsp33 family molecular chaperone HslO [Weissella cibaria]|uniref:33 kDa chaperonin n=1 Tax=Weissella cibaria TaxID=137591 RepID=A0A0D1LJR4_9LACO|nr:Hsp33 family molecular chaperone HslO [Weissella cibaria]KIU20615.1 hypothetical protein QX99_01186 [Weissella cibaria]KIU22843.1 hypothetical protein ff3pr_01322 [Weissella cibaria]MDV8930411.1 Hsp33 family molecular chaperone HslO [Weissella cibaria]
MTDTLVRAVTTDGNFRAIAIDATEMMAEVAKFHEASQLGTTVLGRALLGSLMVSNAILKGDERLAVVINGDGPAGKIVVEASAQGEVRGYVTNPTVELPLTAKGMQDVAGAVGSNGFLQVTKEIGEGDPFTGQVELMTGEIGDDLTYYMAKSEQIPSAVAVSVLVDPDGTVAAAGGFMISALPDASDEDITALEDKFANLPSISSQLVEGHTPMDLLFNLFGKDDVKLLATTEVALYPEISKRDYERMLATLPMKDLQEMLAEDHGVEIVDRFTGKKIQFDEAELSGIIAAKDAEGL